MVLAKREDDHHPGEHQGTDGTPCTPRRPVREGTGDHFGVPTIDSSAATTSGASAASA